MFWVDELNSMPDNSAPTNGQLEKWNKELEKGRDEGDKNGKEQNLHHILGSFLSGRTEDWKRPRPFAGT